MKYTSIYILLLIIIICHSAFSQTKRLQFEHLSIEDGLSQSSIRCVLRDSKGFLWIGTQSGLNRYDGYKFVVYKKNEKIKNSISESNIIKLCESKDHKIWIGTLDGGLNEYDPETETFTNYTNNENDKESIADNTISSLFEDKDGILWVGGFGKGLSKFDKKTRKFKRYSVNRSPSNSIISNRINCIAQDKDGSILLATDKGLDCLNPQTEVFKHYPFKEYADKGLVDTVLSVIEINSKNELWIGTEGGACRFDRKTKEISAFKNDPKNASSIASNRVTTIIEGPNQEMWFGTSEGVSILNAKTGKFSNYKHQKDDPWSIGHDNISTIYKDRFGIIWIGQWENGLNKCDPTKQKFGLASHLSNGLQFPEKTIRSILAEDNGIIWFGTVEGGLYFFDRNKNQIINYKNDLGLEDFTITSICRDRFNGLWVGTYNAGAYKAEFSSTDKNRITKFVSYNEKNSGLSGNIVQKIFKDSKGRLWVGTRYGLDLWDETSKKFIHFIYRPQDAMGSIQCAIDEDKNGFLWVGSWGGLYRIDPNGATKKNISLFKNNPKDSTSLNSDIIISLCITKKGEIWVGTHGSGINKVIPQKNGTIICKHFTEREGLADNVIYSILDDENGNLWLGSNKGLTNWLVENDKCLNYDESDGLQSKEFFWGASGKSPDGELVFGGIKGINFFKSENIKKNSYLPSVVFTDFKLFNQTVKIGPKSLFKKNISETSEIVLSKDDKVISIEFAALHLTSPNKNKYAYRLEGFDNKWRFTDAKSRMVTYTNLDPGTYNFQVKAANCDDVWNETPTNLRIVMLPPWWKTWWFRLLSVLFVVASIVYYVRQRVNMIAKQKDKLEILVRQRTVEIQEKNAELQQQTEEISVQRDYLEEVNKLLQSKNDKITNQNNEINLQKDAIERKNKNITASIQYAQRIQKAVLPRKKDICSVFPDSFILFKPIEIVSGDFYYFKQIEETVVIAAADCTGHGIPGAFMSMLGIAFLNEVVRSNVTTDPGQMLNLLRNQMKTSLQQKGIKGEQRDGMDIGICSINTKTLKMQFAGANIPLYLLRSSLLDSNTNEDGLIEEESFSIFTADRMPIGVYPKEADFTNHTIQLNKGDTFYLLTDGFESQFGGEKGEKFKSKRLQETLHIIQAKPIEQQELELTRIFESWKGERWPQVDDVLVIGVKV